MSLDGKTLKVCSCNRTVALDAKALAAALKKLFNDPHFNIPDPFEPYSGDWTGEVLPPEMLATLNQAKVLLFDKQHEPEQAQAEAQEKTEEKPEDRPEGKLADKVEEKADEPRRQDA